VNHLLTGLSQRDILSKARLPYYHFPHQLFSNLAFESSLAKHQAENKQTNFQISQAHFYFDVNYNAKQHPRIFEAVLYT